MWCHCLGPLYHECCGKLWKLGYFVNWVWCQNPANDFQTCEASGEATFSSETYWAASECVCVWYQRQNAQFAVCILMYLFILIEILKYLHIWKIGYTLREAFLIRLSQLSALLWHMRHVIIRFKCVRAVFLCVFESFSYFSITQSFDFPAVLPKLSMHLKHLGRDRHKWLKTGTKQRWHWSIKLSTNS